jgi:hypothetical protein
MEVLTSKDNRVDLESPIFMTDEQFKLFADGLNDIFGEVEVHEVEELDKNMPDIDRTPKAWKPKELVHLLSDKSHEEVAGILGRKPFSIKSKRGVWIGPFMNWAESRGYIKGGQIVDKFKAVSEYESTKERDD